LIPDEPLATELAGVRRLVGGEVEGVREIATIGVANGRRSIATGRGVGVRLGDGADVVRHTGVLRGLQDTGSDGADGAVEGRRICVVVDVVETADGLREGPLRAAAWLCALLRAFCG
jgi:hypothetical protein